MLNVWSPNLKKVFCAVRAEPFVASLLICHAFLLSTYQLPVAHWLSTVMTPEIGRTTLIKIKTKQNAENCTHIYRTWAKVFGSDITSNNNHIPLRVSCKFDIHFHWVRFRCWFTQRVDAKTSKATVFGIMLKFNKSPSATLCAKISHLCLLYMNCVYSANETPDGTHTFNQGQLAFCVGGLWVSGFVCC